MTKTRFTINALALFIFSLAFTALARAQQAQTFVTTKGIDTAQCTRNQPCQTFAGALDKTNPGGQVVALETGDYGAVTITKAVTIVGAPGVHATITPVAGVAVEVAAGPGDVVVLRNLYLGGQGGVHGINFHSGAVLHVESCVITDFTNLGIYFHSPGGELFVKDTTVRNNDVGIYLDSNAGALSATLENCRLEKNSDSGLKAVSGDPHPVRVMVRNSFATGNNVGFYAKAATPGDVAEIILENSVVTKNGTGIYANGLPNGTPTVDASNSIITQNSSGLIVSGSGAIYSRRNNTLHRNVLNGMFTGVFNAQ